MKNIEKQLIKSAKQLPSMQKEIVFSKKDDKIHNRKSFCAVAIAALSLMICFGVTLSINADYVEEVIKNIAKPEPVSSEVVPPPIINKTISVPINVSFEGDTSQTKSQQTDTYDVIEGDTVILDVVINDANIGNVLNIMSTINFDPAMLSFVSCTNNSYTQDASGTITVQYFGGNPQDQGANFKMEFKVISSGSISFNSEINRTIVVVPDIKDFVKESDEKIWKDMEGYNKRHGIYASRDDILGNYNSGNGNGNNNNNNNEIVIFPDIKVGPKSPWD